ENVKILQFNELLNLDIDQEIGLAKEEEIAEEELLFVSMAFRTEGSVKKNCCCIKTIQACNKILSGGKYSTLSLMYPTIRELQNQYIVNLHSDEISNSENDKNNNNSENENENEFYSQLDLACDTCSHALSSPPNLDLIEKNLKMLFLIFLEKN
ncbi:9062_t:CDS:2, partial [Gigaspora rosea]